MDCEMLSALIMFRKLLLGGCLLLLINDRIILLSNGFCRPQSTNHHGIQLKVPGHFSFKLNDGGKSDDETSSTSRSFFGYIDEIGKQTSQWLSPATPSQTIRRTTSGDFAGPSQQKRAQRKLNGVPTNGIVDYIGKRTTDISDWLNDDVMAYVPPSKTQEFMTKFNLWRQYPWKKIRGKVVLKVKVGGSLTLEPSSGGGFGGFGGAPDLEPVDSLTELSTLFQFGAHDPRILGVLMDISSLQCGYAKLQELRKSMKYFQESGKPIIGYCAAGSEKEFFVSLGCDEFYIPPDGGLDLRGFSGSASFVRGVFDKIGVEPQVQRIGKYKSFGDTFNRTFISEAQREVISSLLTETSGFWVDTVAKALNKSNDEVYNLWATSGVKTAYSYKDLGFVSGVRYLDQVESDIKFRLRKPESGKPFAFRNDDNNSDDLIAESSLFQTDFDLQEDFVKQSRRSPPAGTMEGATPDSTGKSSRNSAPKKSASDGEKLYRAAVKSRRQLLSRQPALFPAGLYLRKMRMGNKILQGLRMQEVQSGPRIAIINAVGGISPGKSSSSGINGKTLGSDTLIDLIRSARNDPSIRAVVLRIDSPGGSALASDLMWRELRLLSREKPVVASQVDVAASGGYYLSMACDQIIAEESTITGSIGVVTSKFNLEKLNSKIGLSSETLSIGRYAEILSSSRGFTAEESDYFEEGAWKAYTSFITKAAASRNMSVEAMNEVAQGRVWTGRQALERNLVDDLGGLWKALTLAVKLSNSTYLEGLPTMRVQTFKEPRSGFPFPIPGGGSRTSLASSTLFNDMKYSADVAIFDSGLVSPSSVGVRLAPLANMLTQSSGALGDLLSNQVTRSSTEGILADVLNVFAQVLDGF